MINVILILALNNNLFYTKFFLREFQLSSQKKKEKKKFQPMTSTPDGRSLSSNQDTNQFLI